MALDSDRLSLCDDTDEGKALLGSFVGEAIAEMAPSDTWGAAVRVVFVSGRVLTISVCGGEDLLVREGGV